MKKRQVIITLLFLLLIPAAVFLSNRMKSNSPESEISEEVVAPVRKVQVSKVVLEDHKVTQAINGRVVARNRYGIYADVPGRMLPTRKEFREGVYFRKGDVLIHLDNTAEREALKARKTLLFNKIAAMLPDLEMTLPDETGKWKDYLNILEPGKAVPDLPAFNSSQERMFVSARDILNQYYNIKSEEERLQKFVEIAPFSGQLTETAVLPGSYVQPGQRLGELTGTGHFEMETSVPISELAGLSTGREVQLMDPERGKTYTGIVDRVVRAIDERTQTGKVILRLKGDGLFQGQFLSGNIVSDHLKDCARVRRSLLLPGSELFTVKDNVLTKVEVQPLAYESEWVYVRGLEEGSLLLNESSPSFQEGLEVEYE